MRNILFVSLITLAFSTVAFGYGVGLSTYPLAMDKKIISGEVTGVVSKGGGMGVQARYTQNLNVGTTFDAGMGVSGGDRANRIFAGIDYELFPDYDKQPRTSLKASISNAKEFNYSQNVITLMPTVSKGFSFWGKEGFPYVALPYNVSLNSDTKTYQTSFNFTTGITGRIPVDGYNQLLGQIEASVNVKDSYSGVFFGVSYPLN